MPHKMTFREKCLSIFLPLVGLPVTLKNKWALEHLKFIDPTEKIENSTENVKPMPQGQSKKSNR